MSKRQSKQAPRHRAEATMPAVSRRSAATPDRPRFAACFYLAVFSSAFLLFQVQPLIGKAILPWYGGSPAVWTTSMLFFQVVLLAGYWFAHVICRYVSPKLQWGLYTIIVLIGVVLLPIQPDTEWKPVGSTQAPTWHLLSVLGRAVGVQFLLLATNAPLLQVWWYRVTRQSPYRLYALSNAGSLSGLISYPFLVEPHLGLRRQSLAWSLAFAGLGLLVIGCGILAWRADPSRITGIPESDQEPAPSRRRYAAWIMLSAAGSVLLLAMTNHLSQDVAVVPFLWVAPLTLYLLSFILAFGDARLYRRGIFATMMILTTLICAFWYRFDVVGNVLVLLLIHLAALFAGCMLCHGELARLKPRARHLTSFYLTLSLGGALGGVFVSFVAPLVFLRYYEYPLALIACWLIMIAVFLRDESSWLYRGRPLWAWTLMMCCFVAFLLQIQQGVIRRTASSLLTNRDFYGVLAVRRAPGEDPGHEWFELSHGTVVHGAQYIRAEKQFEPTTYYVERSGLGYVMRHQHAGKTGRRVGVVGLGVGTVAAYSESGDYFRAYEIDPNVIRIATNPNIFTFWSLLAQRGAASKIVPGDARISLEHELEQGEPQEFDALVLDAFSGDAVPVHLLTREAFAVYFQHLASNGIIAIHISNSHLNLFPVVRAVAANYRADLAAVVDPGRSDWLLMARQGDLDDIVRQNPDAVIPVNTDERAVMWTDDYSNIFSILK